MSEPVSYTCLVSITEKNLKEFLSSTMTYCPKMESFIDWWEPDQFSHKLDCATPMQHVHQAFDVLAHDYNLLIVGYDEKKEILFVRHEYNHDWSSYLEDEISFWDQLSRFRKKTNHKEYAFVSLFPPWGGGLGEQYIVFEFQDSELVKVEENSIDEFEKLENDIYEINWQYGKNFFENLPEDINNEVFAKHYLDYPPVIPYIFDSWNAD